MKHPDKAAALQHSPSPLYPRCGPKLLLAGLLVGVSVLIWFCSAAAVLPITQDEAYYLHWSRELDSGYFDHPPAVAWLARLAHLGGSYILHGRLGTIALTVATFLILGHFFKLCGLWGRSWLMAMALVLFNLGGLVVGLLTTPDAPLMFAWALALHETAAALTSNPRRWLGVGLAVGLDLLSKYTMLLFGPVALVAVWLGKRQTLRSPWPYLGIGLAALICMPNLVWNMQHDWMTWKFQLRHGFSLTANSGLSTPLPAAKLAVLGSPEWELGQTFLAEEARVESLQGIKPSPPGAAMVWPEFLLAIGKILAPLGKQLQHVVNFLASQLLFWGLLLFPLILGLWRRLRLATFSPGAAVVATPQIESLLWAATWVPIMALALVALGGKVEANWSAMYLLAAAGWLAMILPLRLGPILLAGLGNLGLISAVIAHAYSPLLPIKPQGDRILKETHGYPLLAAEVSYLQGSIFTDSYQIASQLNYYLPHRLVGQWPGVTRPSEFLRRQAFAPASLAELKEDGLFWLVTTNTIPPAIDGFTAASLRRLDDCREGYLTSTSSTDLPMQSLRPCARIHRWFLIAYRRAS